MFRAASLLTILFLVVSVVASPAVVPAPGVAKLSLTKRINTNGGTIDVAQQSQARATALKRRGADNSVAVANSANLYYVAEVGIGSPPTTYNLIVDTGSSNTFIGGNQPYKLTGTSENTGQSVLLTWLYANFTGDEWLDTVTLSPDLVVSRQSIGVIEGNPNTTLPSGIDGTLGIGTEVTTLIQGGLINEPNVEIPTVTYNLHVQGSIPKEVFSVSFAPTSNVQETNGEILFGGTDSSKYIGEINYTPITTTKSSSYFWGLNQTVSYGGKTILHNTAGIVDTGTYLILLASDAFALYQSAIGAPVDQATTLLKLTTAQYNKLENLNFQIGSETYELIPDAQIWPKALNSYISGTKDAIYSIVKSIGYPSGDGYDFIIGQPFLERFYSVYDATNQQIGFAKTKYTNVIIN